MRYGSITPTDVDGFIEYQDKAFVFFELKVAGQDVPLGQRLALERLCMAVDKPAIAFVAEHDTPPDRDVLAREARVLRYFWGRRWNDCARAVTLGEAVASFLARYENRAA